MSTQDFNGGAILKGRNAPPSHYLFKIDSFSLLSKASIENLITNEFEVGGFKWKMSIYFNGDKQYNVTDHISIYLQLVDITSLPTGWEVNVIINFFIFNHHKDQYFGYQDGRVQHFHAMKRRCGVAKFIDLKTFTDPSNGYLFNDECVFGAEVFIVKNIFRGEYLATLNDPPTYYYSWKKESFSTLNKEFYESELFGCYNWKLILYPKGNMEGKGNCISVFLDVSRPSNPPIIKCLTKIIIRVKNQKNGNDIEFTGDYLYTPSNRAFGYGMLMPLAKLMDSNQGYLVNDTCIIECEVTLIGVVLAK